MARIIFRGAAEVPKSLFSTFEDKLWATPVQAKSVPGRATKFPVFVKTERGTVLVPRYFYMRYMSDRKNDEIAIHERALDEKPIPFVGALWKEQMDGVDELLRVLEKRHGVFGKGRCGTGKTVIGSYILSRIRSWKSVILVDQRNLAEQWAIQIKDHLPEARISFIMPKTSQGKIYDKLGIPRPSPMMKEDTRGNIIIAMAQSLLKRPFSNPPIVASLLVVDEAHKFSTPVFIKSIFHFSFRYSLALSATDKRPDGLEWLFKMALGPTTVQLGGKRMPASIFGLRVLMSRAVNMKEHKIGFCKSIFKAVTYHWCRSNCQSFVPGAICPSAEWGRKIHFTEMNLILSRDPWYNAHIVDAIMAAYHDGRDILVLSKYKEHLTLLKTQCEKFGMDDASLYFGGMDREECISHRVTFATMGVAKHGLDAPWKDTVVFALPVSDAEQPVGRIERILSDKKTPIAVDPIVESVPFYLNQWKKRMKYYTGANYAVKTGNSQEFRVALRDGHPVQPEATSPAPQQGGDPRNNR